MNSSETNAQSPGEEVPRPRWVPAVTALRAAAALFLTVAVLPYAWGRAAILTMIVGRPETPFALLLLSALVAAVLATFHLADRFRNPRARHRIWLAASIGWIATNVGILVVQAGGSIGLVTLTALYVPATLWLLWAAWLFYESRSARSRLAVLLALAVVPLPFFWLVRADGMMGDTRIQFAWSSQPLPMAQATLSSLPDSGFPSALAVGAEYSQFLGPQRTATLPAVKLSRDWKNRPPRIVWKKAVGAGWSAFAISGGRAFTQEQRGENECVVCYSLSDGREIWVHSDAQNFNSSMGGPGPRATPTLHEGRVYSLGGTGLLNCLDARDGKRLWSVNIMDDNGGQPIAHGVCSSPLIVGEMVIVSPTGRDDRSLVAYNRLTGRRMWQGGAHGQSYSSPIAVSLCGAPQILLFTHAALDAHDPATGKLLWSFPWQNTTNTNVAQPIVHAGETDRVLVSTGYAKGCALLQIRPGGGSFTVDTLKTSREMKTKFTSPVLYDGHVYGLDDGILQCIALPDLQERWKAGRYGHGQILLAGDLLIVQAEKGDVVLVEPRPEKLVERGRVPALDGKTWNNPALAPPFLLVRNDREAACLELPMEE